MSWLRFCLMISAFFLALDAKAQSPKARASLAPHVGVAVGLHPRITLSASGTGRFIPNQPKLLGDPLGFMARGGFSFGLHQIIALDVSYSYAQGHYPSEGPAIREHTPQLGLRITKDAGVVVVSNRTRLDFRVYETKRNGFTFHIRPRNETALTFVIRREAQISMSFDTLVQPSYGLVDMLQVRPGLALHGSIDLRKKNPDSWRKPAFMWFAGAQVSLSPVSLAKARFFGSDSSTTAQPRATDFESVIDVIATFGIAMNF